MSNIGHPGSPDQASQYQWYTKNQPFLRRGAPNTPAHRLGHSGGVRYVWDVKRER